MTTTITAIFAGLFPGLFALGSLGVTGALLLLSEPVPSELWLLLGAASGYVFGERAPSSLRPPGGIA